jgi:hypothetical protein
LTKYAGFWDKRFDAVCGVILRMFHDLVKIGQKMKHAQRITKMYKEEIPASSR